MIIRLSRAHFPITTLGPGERLGIWFQGCSIRCPGCISSDTWAEGPGGVELSDALASVHDWLVRAQGVTISGGEPFDQPAALAELLRSVRKTTNADVLVFTGYRFEQLAEQLAMMSGLIDALITDPYDREAPQTLALRGSDNQRLHTLTPVGVSRFESFNRQLTAADRALDFMFDADGTAWFAGIPRKGDFAKLARNLDRAGHRVWTSEAK